MDLFKVYPLFDLEIVRGDGKYVYDKNGQQYLDFYGGHAVISIGHSHPHYIERVTRQVQQLGFYSNSVQNPLQVEYAKKLGELSGLEDYHLFLVNSGAEAIENALKVASFETGKSKVIAFKKAFHGRTSAAVNITDNAKIQAPINTRYDKAMLPMGDLKAVQKQLKRGNVCAVIIEGIQGIGGIHVPDAEFLEALAATCQANNAVLILDEIQSGFGRTGKFFAFQRANIQPDIVTMAKGMGNGFPIGGILLHPRFEAKYGMLGTTFGGNHLACAAGLAVLETLEKEDLIKNAARVGEYLKSELRQIKGIKSVRGEGLMIGIDAGFPIKPMRKEMLFEGQVFTGSSSDPNVLRLLPPLTVSESDVDIFVSTFKTYFEKHQPTIVKRSKALFKSIQEKFQ